MALQPPNKIVIDFLEGVSIRADAVAYARGFISSHFDVPEQSGYYVAPYKDGYAFEVHEGGSRRAYLPSILRTIEESPTATVSVRSGARVLQVSKGPRDSFNSVLLPEELSSYLENIIEPKDNAPALIPYQIDNVVWLFWGVMTLGIGILVLLVTLGFYMMSPKPVKTRLSTGTKVEQLPISQWKKMVEKLDGTNYISQMKFDNGQWTFEVLPNDADAQNPSPADDAAGSAIVMPADSAMKKPAPAPALPSPTTGIR
jgi:hypothetical protein